MNVAKGLLFSLVILCILCAIICAQESDPPNHKLPRGQHSVEAQYQPETLAQWKPEETQNGGQGSI